MNAGVIEHWDDMEKLWHHTFYNEMRVEPEAHPVLLTESLNNPTLNREKTLQIMFESFNVPAAYLEKQHVLALYATGQTSGIVLNAGHTTNAVVVHEGHILKDTIVSNQSLDLTDYIIKYLKSTFPERYEEPKRSYRIFRMWKTSSEVRLMKDATHIKEECCYLKPNMEQQSNKKCKLPDGEEIVLGDILYMCPESMFKQQALSLHEMVYECAEYDSQLFSNIVVYGGHALFTNFDNTFEQMLQTITEHEVHLLPQADELVDCIDKTYHKITKEFMPVIGACILCLTRGMDDIWIDKNDYDECGPTIVHRSCF
eukprot:343795_1